MKLALLLTGVLGGPNASHSIENPDSLDLSTWTVSDASTVSRNSIILLPAVYQRAGSLWNTVPIEEDSFVLDIDFSVTGTQGTSTSGFAIWLKDSMDESITTEDHLFSQPTEFYGVGILFAHQDRNKALNPSISVAINDGTTAWNTDADVPTNDGIYYSYRNTQSLTMRVSKQGNELTGKIKSSAKTGWTECFSVDVGHLGVFMPYLGFSAYSGKAPTNSRTEKADKITVSRVMYESQRIQPPTYQRELEDNGSDEGAQLGLILEKLDRLTATVTTMQKSILHLTKDVGGTKGAANLDKVHDKIEGLTNLFASHKEQQYRLHENLNTIQSKLSRDDIRNPLSEVQELSKKMEASIRTQSKWSSYTSLGILFLIALIGVVLWKRMRDMEKKHIL